MPEDMRLSPRYKMQLLQQIEDAVLERYHNYDKIERFIKEFRTGEWNCIGNFVHNFDIIYKEDSYGNNFIDLSGTLTKMPQDVLFSVAIECGIAVPMILPAFPTFKRTLTAWEYGSSSLINNFDKAYQLVYEEPDQSIALAYSTLESIIKHILESKKIPGILYNPKATLPELMGEILKGYQFFPNNGIQKNIRNIGSSLLKIANEIEELRSDKTFAHGKGKKDYIVNNRLYSVFIVNNIISVGLFLISFFDDKYSAKGDEVDDCPF